LIDAPNNALSVNEMMTSDPQNSQASATDAALFYSWQNLGFGLLWCAFTAYAFLLAPPDRPETLDLIVQLSTGQWADLNPLLVALFNLMGIWPLIYSTILYADGHGQQLPAWPFAVGTFGIGAFSLLPYLAFRQPHGTLGSGTLGSGTLGGDTLGSDTLGSDTLGSGTLGSDTLGSDTLGGDTLGRDISDGGTLDRSPPRLLRFWDSRILAVGLAIASVGLLGYGAIAGDWADFVHQWQTSRFVHVMSLDFVLLSLLFPALIGDDAARRGWTGDRRPAWLGWLVVVPLVGAVIYGCVRPPLTAVIPIQTQSNSQMGCEEDRPIESWESR
jgi:hypothetical protein